tara:strand:- start:48924 stop:50633 length:1710 start_codon:yes stop_codon:yes gene_type:complete
MYKKYSAILISSLALMACGGSNDKSSLSTESLENAAAKEAVYISGRVANFDTGVGLQNIQITAGEHTTITGADGRYSLSGTPPAARLLVNFEGAGFAEHAGVIYLDKEPANNIFNVSLLPVDVSMRFDASLQQTLTDNDSPARVSLPADALVKIDGSAPQGEAVFNLTIIDPTQDINLMPGEMIATNAGATTEPALIESFGAITATFEDSEGNALNLKESAVSTIRIPLADKSDNPPSIIPLYYYNKITGLWVEEGSAVLVADGNERYYEGEVSHFSTWNADALYDQVFIHGCVEDVNGKRLSNINVISKGNDYSGSANTITDAMGNFSVAAKANSSVTVFGFQLGVQTSTINTTTNTIDEQLAQCLVSSDGGITVKMSWTTPDDRFSAFIDAKYGDNHYLYSDLKGPKYEVDDAYWDIVVSMVGHLLEFPFMDIFLSDYETGTSGEELLVIVQFPLAGKYRYVVGNELSKYFPGSDGISAGFYPSMRRISDARVELNINGIITVFLPPPGEGDENVNWNTLPPLKEAPNVVWEVFDFVVASDGSFTVVPLNNWLPQTTWNGYAPPPPN